MPCYSLSYVSTLRAKSSSLNITAVPQVPRKRGRRREALFSRSIGPRASIPSGPFILVQRGARECQYRNKTNLLVSSEMLSHLGTTQLSV